MQLFTHKYGSHVTIVIKFSMEQFCIPRNHGVKFGENRITFDPNLHIKCLLEIHIGIEMKFDKNVYFVNLNHINRRVNSVSAYYSQKPGFVSQVSCQQMKYEKYFLGDYLSADFWQKP